MTPATLREGSARAASPEKEIARCVTPPFVVYVLAAPLVGAGLAALVRAASVSGCADVTAVCSVPALIELHIDTVRRGGAQTNAVILSVSSSGLDLLNELWQQRDPFGLATAGVNNAPSVLTATALALECRQSDTYAQITAAAARGVRVFLTTDDTHETLIRSMEAAAKGHGYLSASLRSVLGGKASHKGTDEPTSTKTGPWPVSPESRSPSWVALSERQREVALLAAAGLSNGEIGERLFIDITTVKTHLGDTYRKMGIRRRSQLALHLTLSP